MKKLLLLILSIYIFNGCTSKQEQQEYNKPATYWYNKMLDNISTYNLDLADETFTSLQSEHRNSPLLSSALLLLANAHMKNEEYELAIYYYDSYSLKYENRSLNDYIRYLRIKAKFMAFEQRFRDQNLINETLNDINLFIDNYPNSKYILLVKTMKNRLLMSNSLLDLEIADLYKRKDKPEAYRYYMKKAQASWQETKTIKEPSVSWYRKIFE